MIDRIFSKSKMKVWLEGLVKKYDKGRISVNQLTHFEEIYSSQILEYKNTGNVAIFPESRITALVKDLLSI